MKKIILDGAYGTNLLKYNGKIELLNVEKSHLVSDLQKEYILAGSEIITTNTFGISQFENFNEIANKAVENTKIACENTKTKIAFNIGPDFLRENRDFYAEIEVLDDIDYIFVETMVNFNEIKKAVNAFKSWDKPIFLTISPNIDGELYDNTELYQVAKFAEEENIFALGINCGYGVEHVYDCLVELKKHTKLPLIAKPNIGLPKGENGEYESCGKLLEKMQKIINFDVKYIGLCCGSNAEYIRLLASNIK